MTADARTEGTSTDFDVATLNDFLSRNIAGYAGPVAVQRFHGGQSNPTYRLSAQSGQYVLRKKPSGKLLPSAHAVDREHRVLTALHSSGVPVARTRLYCDDTSVIGTPFFVMDFVQGRIFWDPTLPELDARERRAAWDDFNRVVATLHALDYRAVGLEDYGRPGNYIARQITRWSAQYRASGTVPIPAMDRLIEWLPAHIPPGDEVSIVHGDLRLDNMMFHPHEPRIIAMLDWELSTLGHPLADLAYHVMTWRLTNAQFRGMAGNDLAALGIPPEKDYVDSYCRRVGRAPVAPQEWEFYMAFSMFRLAAILQGIARRALDGTASNANAGETGARAGPIAELAWRQVQSI
jgi:aminoglycoside phosphotransferase (APT) family kinase protein